ncbi:MAG: DUF1905 domain-containing protein [Capsulimonas sp.]|uniref:DUF1905 domain-containing protein n=1 Tax=Capsulimonas sp. TaxID=2494211 RepID=UPI00326607C8
MSNAVFTATIAKENKEGGWTFVTWPESVAFLGTGKATKVSAKIGGHEFTVTSLPTGDGTHFLPLSKPVMKAIGKVVGETVEVEVWRQQ